ncbi:MAG: sugar phosphate isomerase/epimerase family protein [Fimbriiglobus sp.]
MSSLDAGACRRCPIEALAMIVACSTLCFSGLPLMDALRVMREMHFAKADLAIHEGGPHLTPKDVMADVGRWATKLRTANLPFAAFHFETRELHGPEAKTQLKAICRLARIMAVPVLTTLASDVNADFDLETTRLADWLRITEGEGVILTLETNSQTLTADPASALELCRRLPGLGLTLDPSHYLAGPFAGADYDKLFKYVRHVRLRDSGTKADQFQTRVGQGEIEYGKLLTSLERFDYDRALTVDFRETREAEFPIDAEVRKLKFLLESQV